MERLKNKLPIFSFLIILVLMFGVLSLFIGPEKISSDKVISALVSPDNSPAANIIRNSRLPRLVMIAELGATLAIVGAVFQAVMRSPIADPYILAISTRTGLISLVAVAIAMVMYGGASSLYFMILGDISGTTWSTVLQYLPFLIIAVGIALLFSRDLDGLLHGEFTAKSFGVEVEWVRTFVGIIAGIIAAATVPFCGAIPFIGMFATYFVRSTAGARYKYLVPAAVLSGSVVLLLADMLSRVLFGGLALSIITVVPGIPMFFYMIYLRRSKK
jgi:ABC-type Fe3+-siderophore transport system permease subunit